MRNRQLLNTTKLVFFLQHWRSCLCLDRWYDATSHDLVQHAAKVGEEIPGRFPHNRPDPAVVQEGLPGRSATHRQLLFAQMLRTCSRSQHNGKPHLWFRVFPPSFHCLATKISALSAPNPFKEFVGNQELVLSMAFCTSCNFGQHQRS